VRALSVTEKKFSLNMERQKTTENDEHHPGDTEQIWRKGEETILYK
jgi:hypothetical protein